MEKKLLTTPTGKTEWFSLAKVDKFGNYTCDLILEDEPATHKFLDEVKEFAAGLPINFVKKTDDGKFKIKMRLKSVGQKRNGEMYKVNPPAIYSPSAQIMSQAELLQTTVANGSKLRAKVQLTKWEMNGKSGVSCKPLSAQIVKLESLGAYSSDELGFDAVEAASVNVETEEQEATAEVEAGEYDF